MANEKDMKTDLASGGHDHHYDTATYEERRRMSAVEVQDAIRSGSVPAIHGRQEALDIARAGGWEADALIESLEKERLEQGEKRSVFDLEFSNPKHFTWLLVAFASMGGLLSGLGPYTDPFVLKTSANPYTLRFETSLLYLAPICSCRET